MKNFFCLTIDPIISLENAWEALESHGIEILYGSEDEAKIELFSLLHNPSEIAAFSWIQACTPSQLPPIDWEAQWAAHGKNFHEGYVHLDLSAFKPNAPSLKMQPGPGFGDLSHPTTRLMLQLLSQQIKNQTVIDIGCGSGVLSIAAAALGAKHIYGLDIDPEAISHSHQNARLNHLDRKYQFQHPKDFSWKTTRQTILILMNMIQSEQEMAWNSLPMLHHQPAICVTSGIPLKDRENYLQLTSSWGWTLAQEAEEEGWLAFSFLVQN